MSIRYPDEFGDWFFDRTPLREYKFLQLDVAKDGKVRNCPDIAHQGDTFVGVERRHDLSCLLKDLPPSILRELSSSRVVRFDGCKIMRPRSDRDDLLTVSKSTKRKSCFYGAHYLLGKKPGQALDVSDVDNFVKEYAEIMDAVGIEPIRPIVAQVAKAFMYYYLRPWRLVTHDGIPREVIELFMKYGRGANLDTSVLGVLEYSEEKIDQKMSYLSVMSKLDSPVTNVFRGIEWMNDGGYSPDDAYGVYIIDCWIDENLVDTPVYEVSGGAWIPVVGKIERQVVLKPTLDDLKLLETLGMAKVYTIHDSWRFKGRNRKPYTRLFEVLSQIRGVANYTSNFFKLVSCAPWGLTLAKNVYITDEGLPVLRGNYWFNPVIGYTTTDLMRSINFRTKLQSQGKISAEVVDMLIGEAGTNWYDKDVYRSKSVGKYLHLSPLFHVSEGDDKLKLLDALKECRSTVLKREVKSRYTFGSMHLLDTDTAVRDWLFRERTTEITISPSRSSKRLFSTDLKKLPLKYLCETSWLGRPTLADELYKVQPAPDSIVSVFELLEDTFLETILKEGIEWT